MSFARKLKRKEQNKRKTRCCGQQMTHKAGYGYICEKYGVMPEQFCDDGEKNHD